MLTCIANKNNFEVNGYIKYYLGIPKYHEEHDGNYRMSCEFAHEIFALYLQEFVSHNALFWKSQTHSVNVSIIGNYMSMDSIYDFYSVYLDIPVKNYIVGMLLMSPNLQN